MIDAPYVRLDFAEGPLVGPHEFRNPIAILTTNDVNLVITTLQAVEQTVSDGRYAVGFVSYEAAPAFDSAFQVNESLSMPLVWFGIFQTADQVTDSADVRNSDPNILGVMPSIDEACHTGRVEEIRCRISNGEVYQVNLTFPIGVTLTGEPHEIYRKLSTQHSEPFSAYIDTGKQRITSLSPELFFRVQGDEVVTRPMKGTSQRGRWAEEDAALSELLQADEKQRAENLMIVDLLRNDLGRIAVPGSVCVPKLFEVERHPSLLQMTSTITATRRPEIGVTELFAALFPCGSVTGAPKIAAMNAINELEQVPRGVYCGAIGVIAPNGDCAFSVAIRTLDSDGQQTTYGVGGGIVWDSKPSEEWREAISKSQTLKAGPDDFNLIETIRLENGTYALWERHVDRLRTSADYFQFKFFERDLIELAEKTSTIHPDGAWKSRFLLSRKGKLSVSVLPLLPIPPDPRFTISKEPVDNRDVFLFHKTTRRDMYDTRRADNAGVFDVLLLNQSSEVTEFTTGNVAVKLGGIWRTPPRDAGLLNGTLREELLSTGVLIEATISVVDVIDADAIWFLNGVRGVIPVRLPD